MTRQDRVKAALVAGALGLLVGSTAVAAEQEGLYFSLSGGLTAFDESKDDIDQTFVDGFSQSFPTIFVDSDLDDSDKGWSAQVGYRWGRYVAAEVGYLDLGQLDYIAQVQLQDGLGGVFIFDTDLRVQSAGPFVSLLGMFPISDAFDIHGRAGLYFGDTRAQSRLVVVMPDDPSSFVSFQEKDSSRDVFLGIGGSWSINESFSVRLEYQRFLDVGDDHTGESDVDFINASILFR